jgi:hypothetical protein
MADIASHYLDALERAGIPPGPLRCLHLVSPPSLSPYPQQQQQQQPPPAEDPFVSPPSTTSVPPQPQPFNHLPPLSSALGQLVPQSPPLSAYAPVRPLVSEVPTGEVSSLDRGMMVDLGKKRDREMVDRLDTNLKNVL